MIKHAVSFEKNKVLWPFCMILRQFLDVVGWLAKRPVTLFTASY